MKHENQKLNYVPLLDGNPIDDYANDIVNLQDNKDLTSAHKNAISIGDDADIPPLSLFASGIDKVYSLSNILEFPDSLTVIFKFIGCITG